MSRYTGPSYKKSRSVGFSTLGKTSIFTKE